LHILFIQNKQDLIFYLDKVRKILHGNPWACSAPLNVFHKVKLLHEVLHIDKIVTDEEGCMGQKKHRGILWMLIQ